MLRPALPRRYTGGPGGALKHEVLNHSWGEGLESDVSQPATMSARLDVPVLEGSPEYSGVKGSPLCSVTMLPRVQPPAIVRSRADEWENQGIS